MTRIRKAGRGREYALVAVAVAALVAVTSVMLAQPSDSTVFASLLIVVLLGAAATVAVALLRRSSRKSAVAEDGDEDDSVEVIEWLRDPNDPRD